jgi:hypothetical protein
MKLSWRRVVINDQSEIEKFKEGGTKKKAGAGDYFFSAEKPLRGEVLYIS